MFRCFEYIVLQKKNKHANLCTNIRHWSFHNIFIISVITYNHQSFNINYSFLYLIVLEIGTFHAWSNETSKYFICFITNILLRSYRFTKQSFDLENKFLPRTVLRKSLHKLKRNLLQRLELASIVLKKDTFNG